MLSNCPVQGESCLRSAAMFVRSNGFPLTLCPQKSKLHSPLTLSSLCVPRRPRSFSKSVVPKPSIAYLHTNPCSTNTFALFVFLREDMERAVQSGDWREVREFYLTTFDSFIEINAAFKVEYTHTESVPVLRILFIMMLKFHPMPCFTMGKLLFPSFFFSGSLLMFFFFHFPPLLVFGSERRMDCLTQ